MKKRSTGGGITWQVREGPFCPRHFSAAALVSITCLVFGWTIGAAAGVRTAPTNGLVQILLSPAELGPGSARRVRLLLDPQTEPKVYYPSKDDLPGSSVQPLDPVDPASPFKRELDREGGEAAVYLAYCLTNRGCFYVKIVRFSTTAKAESYWSNRCQPGPRRGHLVGIPEGNVLMTEPGQEMHPGVKAMMEMLEFREGKYVVRLAPGQPDLHHPGLQLLQKQIEKIRRAER